MVAAHCPRYSGQSLQRLQSLLRSTSPPSRCLGLAGGRSALSIRRIGININDARIPDNGAQPIDLPVQAAGPPPTLPTCPSRPCCVSVQRAGVPCKVSQTGAPLSATMCCTG